MGVQCGLAKFWRTSIVLCMGLLAPNAAVHAAIGSELHLQNDRRSWIAWRTQQALPLIARPVNRSDFSGKGVRIGVLDQGFEASDLGDPALALATTLEEYINPEVGSTGVHGTVVSRIVAGQTLDDTFERGMAHRSKLYLAHLQAPLLTYTFPQFYERGVSIINNSWEFFQTYEERMRWLENAGALHRIHDDEAWQRRAVLVDNQLLIWAAGNAGESNVSWPAAAPSLYPALEKGWMAVTWLNADGTLHSRANACGIAANWCISSFSGHSELGGTSYAAPVVTATAGLVSEAFPWMDNSALRQTLLSTADPLGDPARYGWGQINPDRAVRGPGRFDKALAFNDYFYAIFNEYRSEFFNDIQGDAGLVKGGTGTLVLWGKNTYTGETYVDDGRLELYGSVAGALVNWQQGTLFTNGGNIGGSLFNENVVQVKGAGLRVNGDLFTDGGTLQVQFGSSVAVDGNALIQGGRLEMTDVDPWGIFAKRATVLRAANIQGQFDSVSGGGLLLNVQPIYRGNRVDVVVQRNPATGVAHQHFAKDRAKLAAANALDVSLRSMERESNVEPNAEVKEHFERDREKLAVANTLDVSLLSIEREPDVEPNTEIKVTLTENSPPAVHSVDATAHRESINVSEAFIEQVAVLHDVSSVRELGTALDSLTGEIHATSQALSFQQTQAINRALSNRVDGLAQAGQESGLWVSMLGTDGKLRQRGYATANTHVFGAQLGADHRLGESSIIGAALSWSEGKARFEGLGGTSKGQGIGVSLYGRYGVASGNYLAGRIGHDRIQSKVSRSIVINQAERIASNRQDGMTSLYAEAGHVFEVMESKYTPFIGAEYNHLRRGEFEETGSPLALRASSASYDEAAVSLGLHYQSSPILWGGGETTLRGSGAYRYGNAPNLYFSAAFNGAPDASFSLQGVGLPKHSGWLGLGMATQPHSTHVNWFVNIDMQLDRKGVNNNAISAGLRYDFG